MKVYLIDPVIKWEKPLCFFHKWAAEDTVKETLPDDISEEDLKKEFEKQIKELEVIE